MKRILPILRFSSFGFLLLAFIAFYYSLFWGWASGTGNIPKPRLKFASTVALAVSFVSFWVFVGLWVVSHLRARKRLAVLADYEAAASIIEAFVEGTSGQWDWDGFTSIRKKDPFLESVRTQCIRVHDNYPATDSGHYCNAKGVEVLRALAKGVRSKRESVHTPSLPKYSANLGGYEAYIYLALQWLCSECGEYADAVTDIRAGEEKAPNKGTWTWRKAKEAMESGWYVPPRMESSTLPLLFCLCPNCANANGLVVRKVNPNS